MANGVLEHDDDPHNSNGDYGSHDDADRDHVTNDDEDNDGETAMYNIINSRVDEETKSELNDASTTDNNNQSDASVTVEALPLLPVTDGQSQSIAGLDSKTTAAENKHVLATSIDPNVAKKIRPSFITPPLISQMTAAAAAHTSDGTPIAPDLQQERWEAFGTPADNTLPSRLSKESQDSFIASIAADNDHIVPLPVDLLTEAADIQRDTGMTSIRLGHDDCLKFIKNTRSRSTAYNNILRAMATAWSSCGDNATLKDFIGTMLTYSSDQFAADISSAHMAVWKMLGGRRTPNPKAERPGLSCAFNATFVDKINKIHSDEKERKAKALSAVGGAVAASSSASSSVSGTSTKRGRDRLVSNRIFTQPFTIANNHTSSDPSKRRRTGRNSGFRPIIYTNAAQSNPNSRSSSTTSGGSPPRQRSRGRDRSNRFGRGGSDSKQSGNSNERRETAQESARHDRPSNQGYNNGNTNQPRQTRSNDNHTSSERAGAGQPYSHTANRGGSSTRGRPRQQNSGSYRPNSNRGRRPQSNPRSR